MSKFLPCKINVRLSHDAICRIFQLKRLCRKYGLSSVSVSEIIECVILSIEISKFEQVIQRMSALDNK